MWGTTARGFSLLELMIAVAIVAILAAVAFPSYQAHVRSANRAEAMQVLQEIGAAMERYALQNGNYNAPNLAAVYTLDAGRHPAVSRYSFALSAAAASWAVTATPTGAQAGDGALVLYWDGRAGWDSDNNGSFEPFRP